MGVKEDLGRGGPWSVVQNIPAFFAQIFLLVYAFHFLLSLILFLPFRLLPWEAFPNTPQAWEVHLLPPEMKLLFLELRIWGPHPWAF